MFYYVATTFSFWIYDKRKAPGAYDPTPVAYKDDFFLTEDGDRVLRQFRANHRAEYADRQRQDKEREQTEEGRNQLELEKQQRSLTSVQ